jgi:cysteinyl-tRNA synthetase
VDIRGGGLENIFPHNECEIAQSEAATDKPFARYWLHWNMVTVDGVKMGKSLGNFTTIKQALQKYSPLAIRFFILTSHYRSPLDFSEEALSGAARGLERLHGTVRLVRARLQTPPPGEVDPALEDMLSQCKAQFLEAMDDDFNTATAIGILFDLNRQVNAVLNGESPVTQGTLAAVDALYRELGGQILGIMPEKTEELGGGLEVPLIELLIEVRQKLREDREWELGDNVRDRMSELGITLEDRSEGTTWRLTA